MIRDLEGLVVQFGLNALLELEGYLNHFSDFHSSKSMSMVFAVTASYAKTVEQLRNRLVRELGDKIESIVLYGSVAKNRASDESDIDFLIVARDDEIGLYDKISKIRTQVDLENNTLTALMYVTCEELEHYAKLGSPFMKSVSKEGKILYDKGVFKKLRGSILEKS